jgi:hypothetical protein
MTRFITFAVAILCFASCKHYVKTMEPDGDPGLLDEEEDEICATTDLGAFFDENLPSLDECLSNMSCKNFTERDFTLVLGCDGTRGGLYVVSDESLANFNQCIVEKSESWDYSGICESAECDCTYGLKMKVRCTEQ